MSNALATYDLDREKVDLIKQTVAKGTTDLELQLFLHACQRTGLDPLMKQIYAIKRKNHATGKEEMSIQTGIDGYRLIADRTGQYAGSDEPTYQVGEDGGPDVASVTVYKLVGGIRCPFSCSARWNEYYQEKGPLWKRMPFLMLAKCAEALALRKAFPAELSGVYTHEEMMQADNTSLPSTKPSDILKRSEQGSVIEPSVIEAMKEINAIRSDQLKAQVMGVDAPKVPSSSSLGMQDGSLPQSHDAPEPLSFEEKHAAFVWQIGKDHKHESISTIPSGYLEWFVQNGKREDHVEAATLELDRRRGQGTLA